MKLYPTVQYRDIESFLPMSIVKQHVRALDDSEDELLAMYLENAVDYVENLTNRYFGAGVPMVSIDRADLAGGPVITVPLPTLVPSQTWIQWATPDGFGYTNLGTTGSSTVFGSDLTVQEVADSLRITSSNDGNTEYDFTDFLNLVELDPNVEEAIIVVGYTNISPSAGTAPKITQNSRYVNANDPATGLSSHLYVGAATSEMINFGLTRKEVGPVRQALLLLVGHWYNQREAEVIGQITSEIKEGVSRLLASVRRYR